MKLGRRGGGVGEGLGFIASFPLCPPFPIQADAVVTRLALAFTVITFWSFFSALDLPILAGPVMFSESGDLIDCLHTYQQPLRLRFLGSALPGFFGRGMSMRREVEDGKLTGEASGLIIARVLS